MDKAELVRAIGQAYQYWRLDKLPASSQIDMWHLSLKHIPDGALNWIMPDLYNEHDSLPRNLPKAIKEIYAKAPPADRKRIVKQFCDQCNGHGFFRIRYENTMRLMVWGMAICKACENWRVDFGQNVYDMTLKAYPKEMELKGYQVVIGSNINALEVDLSANKKYAKESFTEDNSIPF